VRSYSIAKARSHDLPFIAGIELAAAQMLRGHAPASVLSGTTSEIHLREAQAEGRLWVALAGEEPVGFAHVRILARGTAHLEELDVHPSHGHRGLGTRLVVVVLEWAVECRFCEVTLTTFRDVPWNMPFYRRLGFEVLSGDALTPQLTAIVDNETRRGLDPTRRVVMRHRLGR
jgi:GNAT superfamily N-acetyltransferase